MAMHLNVILDAELAGELEKRVRRLGRTRSEVVRDILRAGLLNLGPRERGWREGMSAAYKEGKKAIIAALQQLPKEPP